MLDFYALMIPLHPFCDESPLGLTCTYWLGVSTTYGQMLLVPVLIYLSDWIVSSQAISIDKDHSCCKGMH